MATYNFLVLDPRKEARVAQLELLRKSAPVIGIEVTIPDFAALCLANIDPQHGGGTAEEQAAIEATMSWVGPRARGEGWFLDGLRAWVYPCPDCGDACEHYCTVTGMTIPEVPVTLATVRADLDSIGAMAVLELRRELATWVHLGTTQTGFADRPDIDLRISMVAKSDKHGRGAWPGPRPLLRPGEKPEIESYSGVPAGLAAVVSDFKLPAEERVKRMKQWLLTGTCEGLEQYQARAQTEHDAAANQSRVFAIYGPTHGLKDYPCSPDDNLALCGTSPAVAYVESTHRGATAIGYRVAPVLVAVNEQFGFGGTARGRKFTVAQYATGHVDLKAALADLQALEPGWGGSTAIVGSPQDRGSTLSDEQVVQIVLKHISK